MGRAPAKPLPLSVGGILAFSAHFQLHKLCTIRETLVHLFSAAQNRDRGLIARLRRSETLCALLAKRLSVERFLDDSRLHFQTGSTLRLIVCTYSE